METGGWTDGSNEVVFCLTFPPPERAGQQTAGGGSTLTTSTARGSWDRPRKAKGSGSRGILLTSLSLPQISLCLAHDWRSAHMATTFSKPKTRSFTVHHMVWQDVMSSRNVRRRLARCSCSWFKPFSFLTRTIEVAS